jgi:hypothetical protein
MHIKNGSYSLEEFCRKIIDDTEEVLSGYHYNQIKTFFYLSEEGWEKEIQENYQTRDLGEITEFVGEYVNRKGANQPATFFIGEYEDDLQMVITAETEEAIRQTLSTNLQSSPHLSPMPIMTDDFQRMNEIVLSRYEDMRISEFKSKRVPSLADARIRPDVDRTIEYKGIDGKQRLEEFRNEYGVVPTRIQYEHKNISIKIDTSGKFTLLSLNEESFETLFELVGEVIENVLELRDVARSIKFSKEVVEPGNLKITVPDVKSGQISFAQDISLMRAEDFIKSTKKSENIQFSFSDVTKKAGSLDLSAQVADERRDSLFNISATEESMRIVPKHDCSFPSLIEFYLAIIQMLDGGAKMKLYESRSAS